MFSLILATIAIALIAAYAVVAINYTPWWIPRAQIAQELTAEGLSRLERAYDLASAANADVPPAPTGASDGGLSQLMRAQYGFLPKAPANTTWTYGRQSAAGTFSGMDYICLSGMSVDYPEYVGLKRYANTVGPNEVVLSNACGATSSVGEPSSYPATVALTYYMQYVPGAD
jgi:hypothetical protein